MRSRARHRRSLQRIEQRLTAEDPGLESKFAIFAQLTRGEGMPVTERASGRLSWLHPAVLILLAVLSLLLVSLLVPDRNMCGATYLAAGARQRPSSLTAACPVPATARDRMLR
jgi:hypothetical protein